MTTDTRVDVMAVLDVIDHCAKIIGETGYPHSEAALNKAREAIRELVEAVGKLDVLDAKLIYEVCQVRADRDDACRDDVTVAEKALATYNAVQDVCAARQKFAGV